MSLIWLGMGAALLSAGSTSATDVSTKFATRAQVPTFVIFPIVWSITACILSLACVLWYPGIIAHPLETMPAIATPYFWGLLAVSGALNTIAYFCYVRAFRYSDASLVASITLISPIFLLVTSPIMVGEHVPVIGVVGILSTVVGVYFLDKAPGDTQRFASYRNLLHDRGARSMLVTAAIWSLSANFDKMGIRETSPLQWGACIGIAIAFGSIVTWIIAGERASMDRRVWRAVLPGIANAAQIMFVLVAVSMIFVPYAIAIKRFSAIFTVAMSKPLLGEEIKNRLIGALIMLAGTFLMACDMWASSAG